MRQRTIALILLLVFAAGGIFYFISNNKPLTPPEPISNAVAAPTAFQVSFVNSYPHDTAAFTEGLQYIDGVLYESTGNKDNMPQSTLRKVDLISGKVIKNLKLKDEYFGEGVTVLGDTIYQLTWQNHVGFVYKKADFSLIKTFDVPFEGWGMTTDGKQLYISDGTNIIHVYDPHTLKEVNRISVQDNNGMLSNVNELEWIDGYIYSNVWQTNYILKIDPATGNVVGKTDLTQQIQVALPNFDWQTNVLNGIAYDAATKKIYITGKNWPKLFEVRFN
ncbi:MAG: glutaminyl-peptide cyclotransferase [Sphingobacteriales bacterium]|nr:glutaminyl-peptide cyclotransferase [Sphingobacteriales bacterium]MBI3719247.1 glutaminyl-peptide cyclotransferase [Sphingobacteriales bacterium]